MAHRMHGDAVQIGRSELPHLLCDGADSDLRNGSLHLLLLNKSQFPAFFRAAIAAPCGVQDAARRSSKPVR
jgi:hypothetical protein